MRKVDWMADTRAKTQSSDKTNPLSVSEMTLLYLNAESSSASHSRSTKPKGRGNRSQCQRMASEDEEEWRFPPLKKLSKNPKKNLHPNSFLVYLTLHPKETKCLFLVLILHDKIPESDWQNSLFLVLTIIDGMKLMSGWAKMKWKTSPFHLISLFLQVNIQPFNKKWQKKMCNRISLSILLPPIVSI